MFHSIVRHRPEVTSPMSSPESLLEGAFFINNGASPYASSQTHAPPLLVHLFALLQRLPQVVTHALFTLVIVYISLKIVDLQLYYSKFVSIASAAGFCDGLVDQPSAPLNPLTPAYFFLFNPFTLLSCISHSAAILTHAAIVSAIHNAVEGRLISSMSWLALAAYLDLYPIYLLPATVLLLLQSTDKFRRLSSLPLSNASTLYGPRVSLARVALAIFAFTVSLSILMIVSSLACHLSEHADFESASLWGLDWSWFSHSYGYILSVGDLTPNPGFFWYFFTAIFSRFRSFFLFVFHAQIFAFLAPMVVRFRCEPLFLSWLSCGVLSLFKAYPTWTDTSFSMTLLLVNWELIRWKGRRLLPVIWLFCASCLVGQLMWWLWIYAGSGNANFVYFQGLIQLACACVITIEAMSAVRRLHARASINVAPKSLLPEAE